METATQGTEIDRPSSSYHLLLPKGILQKNEERISSYWLAGESVALQVFSFIRTSGEQIGAKQRLHGVASENGQ